MFSDYFAAPFKRYLTNYLLENLGKYISNINVDEVGVGGDIVLRDVELNLDVLQESLNIPLAFELAGGFIKELRIQIPWTRLFSQPAVVKLSTVELVLVARSDLQFQRLRLVYSRSTLSKQSLKRLGSLWSTESDPSPFTDLGGETGGNHKFPFKANSAYNASPSPLHRKQQKPEVSQGQKWLLDSLHRIVSNARVEICDFVLRYEHESIVLSLYIGSLCIYSADPQHQWREKYQEPEGVSKLIYKACEITDVTINLDGDLDTGEVDQRLGVAKDGQSTSKSSGAGDSYFASRRSDRQRRSSTSKLRLMEMPFLRRTKISLRGKVSVEPLSYFQGNNRDEEGQVAGLSVDISSEESESRMPKVDKAPSRDQKIVSNYLRHFGPLYANTIPNTAARGGLNEPQETSDSLRNPYSESICALPLLYASSQSSINQSDPELIFIMDVNVENLEVYVSRRQCMMLKKLFVLPEHSPETEPVKDSDIKIEEDGRNCTKAQPVKNLLTVNQSSLASLTMDTPKTGPEENERQLKPVDSVLLSHGGSEGTWSKWLWDAVVGEENHEQGGDIEPSLGDPSSNREDQSMAQPVPNAKTSSCLVLMGGLQVGRVSVSFLCERECTGFKIDGNGQRLGSGSRVFMNVSIVSTTVEARLLRTSTYPSEYFCTDIFFDVDFLCSSIASECTDEFYDVLVAGVSDNQIRKTDPYSSLTEMCSHPHRCWSFFSEENFYAPNCMDVVLHIKDFCRVGCGHIRTQNRVFRARISHVTDPKSTHSLPEFSTKLRLTENLVESSQLAENCQPKASSPWVVDISVGPVSCGLDKLVVEGLTHILSVYDHETEESCGGFAQDSHALSALREMHEISAELSKYQKDLMKINNCVKLACTFSRLECVCATSLKPDNLSSPQIAAVGRLSQVIIQVAFGMYDNDFVNKISVLASQSSSSLNKETTWQCYESMEKLSKESGKRRKQERNARILLEGFFSACRAEVVIVDCTLLKNDGQSNGFIDLLDAQSTPLMHCNTFIFQYSVNCLTKTLPIETRDLDNTLTSADILQSEDEEFKYLGNLSFGIQFAEFSVSLGVFLAYDLVMLALSLSISNHSNLDKKMYQNDETLYVNCEDFSTQMLWDNLDCLNAGMAGSIGAFAVQLLSKDDGFSKSRPQPQVIAFKSAPNSEKLVSICLSLSGFGVLFVQSLLGWTNSASAIFRGTRIRQIPASKPSFDAYVSGYCFNLIGLRRLKRWVESMLWVVSIPYCQGFLDSDSGSIEFQSPDQINSAHIPASGGYDTRLPLSDNERKWNSMCAEYLMTTQFSMNLDVRPGTLFLPNFLELSLPQISFQCSDERLVVFEFAGLALIFGVHCSKLLKRQYIVEPLTIHSKASCDRIVVESDGRIRAEVNVLISCDSSVVVCLNSRTIASIRLTGTIIEDLFSEKNSIGHANHRETKLARFERNSHFLVEKQMKCYINKFSCKAEMCPPSSRPNQLKDPLFIKPIFICIEIKSFEYMFSADPTRLECDYFISVASFAVSEHFDAMSRKRPFFFGGEILSEKAIMKNSIPGKQSLLNFFGRRGKLATRVFQFLTSKDILCVANALCLPSAILLDSRYFELFLNPHGNAKAVQLDVSPVVSFAFDENKKALTFRASHSVDSLTIDTKIVAVDIIVRPATLATINWFTNLASISDRTDISDAQASASSNEPYSGVSETPACYLLPNFRLQSDSIRIICPIFKPIAFVSVEDELVSTVCMKLSSISCTDGRNFFIEGICLSFCDLLLQIKPQGGGVHQHVDPMSHFFSSQYDNDTNVSVCYTDVHYLVEKFPLNANLKHASTGGTIEACLSFDSIVVKLKKSFTQHLVQLTQLISLLSDNLFVEKWHDLDTTFRQCDGKAEADISEQLSRITDSGPSHEVAEFSNSNAMVQIDVSIRSVNCFVITDEAASAAHLIKLSNVRMKYTSKRRAGLLSIGSVHFRPDFGFLTFEDRDNTAPLTCWTWDRASVHEPTNISCEISKKLVFAVSEAFLDKLIEIAEYCRSIEPIFSTEVRSLSSKVLLYRRFVLDAAKVIAEKECFVERLEFHRPCKSIKLTIPGIALDLSTYGKIPKNKYLVRVDSEGLFIQTFSSENGYVTYDVVADGFNILNCGNGESERISSEAIFNSSDLRIKLRNYGHYVDRKQINVEASRVSIFLSSWLLRCLSQFSLSYTLKLTQIIPPMPFKKRARVAESILTQNAEQENMEDDFSCLKRVYDVDKRIGTDPAQQDGGQIVLSAKSCPYGICSSEGFFANQSLRNVQYKENSSNNLGSADRKQFYRFYPPDDGSLDQWATISWTYYEPRLLERCIIGGKVSIPSDIGLAAFDEESWHRKCLECQLCFWDQIERVFVMVSNFSVPIEEYFSEEHDVFNAAHQFADALSDLVFKSIEGEAPESTSLPSCEHAIDNIAFRFDRDKIRPANLWMIRWKARCNPISEDARIVVCNILSRVLKVYSIARRSFHSNLSVQWSIKNFRIALLTEHGSMDLIEHLEANLGLSKTSVADEILVFDGNGIEGMYELGFNPENMLRLRLSGLEGRIFVVDYSTLSLIPFIHFRSLIATISATGVLSKLDLWETTIENSFCKVFISPKNLILFYDALLAFQSELVGKDSVSMPATNPASQAQFSSINRDDADGKCGPNGNCNRKASSYSISNYTNLVFWYGQYGTSEVIRIAPGSSKSYSWRISYPYLSLNKHDWGLLERLSTANIDTELEDSSVLGEEDVSARFQEEKQRHFSTCLQYEPALRFALTSSRSLDMPGAWSQPVKIDDLGVHERVVVFSGVDKDENSIFFGNEPCCNLYIFAERSSDGIHTQVRILPSHRFSTYIPFPLQMQSFGRTFTIPGCSSSTLDRFCARNHVGSNEVSSVEEASQNKNEDSESETGAKGPKVLSANEYCAKESEFSWEDFRTEGLHLLLPDPRLVQPVQPSEIVDTAEVVTKTSSRVIQVSLSCADEWSEDIFIDEPTSSPLCLRVPDSSCSSGFFCCLVVVKPVAASLVVSSKDSIGKLPAYYSVEFWPMAIIVNATPWSIACRMKDLQSGETIPIVDVEEKSIGDTWLFSDPSHSLSCDEGVVEDPFHNNDRSLSDKLKSEFSNLTVLTASSVCPVLVQLDSNRQLEFFRIDSMDGVESMEDIGCFFEKEKFEPPIILNNYWFNAKCESDKNYQDAFGEERELGGEFDRAFFNRTMLQNGKINFTNGRQIILQELLTMGVSHQGSKMSPESIFVEGSIASGFETLSVHIVPPVRLHNRSDQTVFIVASKPMMGERQPTFDLDPQKSSHHFTPVLKCEPMGCVYVGVNPNSLPRLYFSLDAGTKTLEELPWSTSVGLDISSVNIVAVPALFSKLNNWLVQFCCTISVCRDDVSEQIIAVDVTLQNRVVVNNFSDFPMKMRMERPFLSSDSDADDNDPPLKRLACGEAWFPCSYVCDNPLLELESEKVNGAFEKESFSKPEPSKGIQNFAMLSTLFSFCIDLADNLSMPEESSWSQVVFIPTLRASGRWSQYLSIQYALHGFCCATIRVKEIKGVIHASIFRVDRPDLTLVNELVSCSVLFGLGETKNRWKIVTKPFEKPRDDDTPIVLLPPRTRMSLAFCQLKYSKPEPTFELLHTLNDEMNSSVLKEDNPDSDRRSVDRKFPSECAEIERNLMKRLIEKGIFRQERRCVVREDLDPRLSKSASFDIIYRFTTFDGELLKGKECVKCNQFAFSGLYSFDDLNLSFGGRLPFRFMGPVQLSERVDEYPLVVNTKDNSEFEGSSENAQQASPKLHVDSSREGPTWVLRFFQNGNGKNSIVSSMAERFRVLVFFSNMELILLEDRQEIVVLHSRGLEFSFAFDANTHASSGSIFRHSSDYELVVRAQNAQIDSYLSDKDAANVLRFILDTSDLESEREESLCAFANPAIYDQDNAAGKAQQYRMCVGLSWMHERTVGLPSALLRIQYVDVRIAPFSLGLEESFLHHLLGIVSPISAYFSEREASRSGSSQKRSLHHGDDLSVDMLKESECLDLRELHISPLSMLVTVHISTLPMFLGFDQTPFRFSEFRVKHQCKDANHFVEDLLAYYISDAFSSILPMIGSLQLLGNPTGLIRSLRLGLYDLFRLPLAAISHGDGLHTIFGQAAKGWLSLFSRVGEGALLSLTGFSDSLARNLDRLSMDEEYKRTRDLIGKRQNFASTVNDPSKQPNWLERGSGNMAERRYAPSLNPNNDEYIDSEELFLSDYSSLGMQSRYHTAKGLSDGLAGLLSGLIGGVTGIVSQPVSKGIDGDWNGVVKSIGKGLLGAVAKPASAAADLVALTSDGLIKDSGLGIINRPGVLRGPRTIFSSRNEALWYRQKELSFAGQFLYNDHALCRLGTQAYRLSNVVLSEKRIIIYSLWDGSIPIDIVSLAEFGVEMITLREDIEEEYTLWLDPLKSRQSSATEAHLNYSSDHVLRKGESVELQFATKGHCRLFVKKTLDVQVRLNSLACQ